MQEYIQVSSLEFHSIYMIYNYLIYKVEQTPYNALSVSCIKFLLTGVCLPTYLRLQPSFGSLISMYPLYNRA